MEISFVIVKKTHVMLAAGFLLTTLVSCEQKAAETTGMLYNIDSLLSVQAQYLVQSNASLQKVSVLGNDEKKAVVKPKDSLAWENELNIFREVESVNKPLNQRYYTIERFSDPRSNLLVKAFTEKKDPNTQFSPPVKYLRIYYHGTMANVRKIEAGYEEENALYKSNHLLTLQFQEVYNKTVLTSYFIGGGQKMFLGDSVAYTIQASVTIPH
ncbi:hypothetical protein [Chryseolinea lacunae]|uniref:Lipoprotein n=1 Tax=Chryseolinea lacunae TaxID=2801331 RepID=A0ABS1KSP5_9BACT|nr:hypothetical protein [Chryseolinea lacunae]MBL0741712.1 hypothetical protein [Chryseolinea lacunae]